MKETLWEREVSLIVTVLIVDDSGIIRDGIRGILRIHHDIAVVGEAVNGLDALQKVRELNPDVILMDAQMPCMDGFEATRSIKQREPKRRILFMTVYASYAEEAQAAGADALLLKDCRCEELVTAIRDLALTRAS